MSGAEMTAMHQYLTFTLGDELFALDIGWVKEILDNTNITRIPRMPDFIRGVINVRERAIPVIDLRLKFGMSGTVFTTNTCIIIAEVRTEGAFTLIGLLADSVQEVLEIEQDRIDPPPRMGAAVDTRFLLGLGKLNERFVLILDIGRVFSHEELSTARHAGGMATQNCETVASASACP